MEVNHRQRHSPLICSIKKKGNGIRTKMFAIICNSWSSPRDREASRKTSESSFFPSAPSSVSFTSKSWQLCPEEEGKPGTSASPLSQRRGRDFDRGCQGNLTRQALCFIGVFKKCAAVAPARVFRTSFCLLLDCYARRRWHWNGMSHGWGGG